jgi:hypothetical protein
MKKINVGQKEVNFFPSRYISFPSFIIIESGGTWWIKVGTPMNNRIQGEKASRPHNFLLSL